MKSILYLDAYRECYSIDQVHTTMTVQELIEYLSQFDEDAQVYLRHDGGYTYGTISSSNFEEEWVEDEEEEN